MKACKDCQNFLDLTNEGQEAPHLHFCEANELQEILDGDPGERNTFIECQCARDLKNACGHGAKWFKPKL